MKTFFLMVAGSLLATGNLVAQTPPAKPAPAPAAKPPAAPAAPKAPPAPKTAETVANYEVSALPENIAPTAATQSKDVEVTGQPRNSTGHPCTLVDKQDIDELKEAIKTNKDAQEAYAKLKEFADKRIAAPLDVPIAQKDADGNWIWPGDFPPEVAPHGKIGRCNEGNGTDIASLGMMYQLSGDEKYGEFAKSMLLAYADNFNNYGHPKDWTPKSYRSAKDGRVTGQFLEDGFWLNTIAFGYDLVRSLPSFTDEQRKHIHDDLLKPVAAIFTDPAVGKPDYISAEHNRSAVCAAGTLMAGYATEDEELINRGYYGVDGTKEAPTGGAFGIHFTDKCLLPDGLWLEGSLAYQTGIASCALFNTAQTAWHHGIDLYRFRGGALKRLLDSAITLAYPTPEMKVAALHDSGSFDLLDDRAWLNNEVGVPFEIGYERYKDQRYIPIINKANKTLSMTVHAGPPSLFQNVPASDTIPPQPISSANFYSTGFGVIRVATPTGTANQLLQEYGPSAGHAHPSKLGIDLFAVGMPLMQFPGVIFPYNDPLDPKWFWTTVGNCALGVDEGQQIYSGNIYKFPRGTPRPEAIQLVFAPASTMGMQRAWSNTLYTGVTQDRALFLTAEYLADIFGTFANGPHKYDLAWHIKGDMTASLTGEPFTFDAALNGYNAMDKTTHANSDKAWTATVAADSGQTVRFMAPGGTATDVYLGTGPQNPHTPKVAPAAMIIQRRADTNNALFASATDLSGGKEAGFIKSVTQEGGLDAGYGLLKIETVKGTDLCLSSFRPGTYKAAGMETDAMQAMSRVDGANVKALYLGGGTKLKVAGGTIARSASGLAFVEKADKGAYIVGNPSPTDATVTVTLPALKGLKAHVIDDTGKSTGTAEVKETSGAFAVHLKAATRVEFKP